MATVVYSQAATFSYGGGAPALYPIHLSYDGSTLSIWATGDSPATPNLASAIAQSGNNVALTLPSSVKASIDAAVFAGLIGQLVTKYYGVGAKDWPGGRTAGI